MSDLGLNRGTVKLVPHNKKWSELFEKESELLQKILKVPRDRIQHVGSTSIKGVVAKPILDIALLSESLEIVDIWKEPLEKNGYWYKGFEPELPDRRFFAKGSRTNRTVHLHVVNKSEFDSLLMFRDKLLDDPNLTNLYSELKKELAKKHSNDRDAYTSSKADFIKRVLGQ